MLNLFFATIGLILAFVCVLYNTRQRLNDVQDELNAVRGELDRKGDWLKTMDDTCSHLCSMLSPVYVVGPAVTAKEDVCSNG